MKLNIRAVLTFVFLGLLLSCEVPYKGNARLLIKGEVLDENNEPISGAKISVFAREGVRFLTGTLTTLLDESETLSDGSFSTILLLPLDENFAIEVFVNGDYSIYQYRTDTNTYTPDDNLIDLGTVPIKRNATINYNITRDTPINSDFMYSFSYQRTECIEVYADGEIDVEATECYEMTTIGRTLNNDNHNDSGGFITPLNSEVIFTYSINGDQEESQTIIVDQTTNEFNFNY